MTIPVVLVRLAPVALRVAKLIVIATPHLLAFYQSRKNTKLLERKKKAK